MVITGVISQFDERRGDGVLRSDHDEQFYFHCVNIADGTRRIAVGARATGRRAVGRCGVDEVVDVTVAH